MTGRVYHSLEQLVIQDELCSQELLAAIPATFPNLEHLCVKMRLGVIVATTLFAALEKLGRLQMVDVVVHSFVDFKPKLPECRVTYEVTLFNGKDKEPLLAPAGLAAHLKKLVLGIGSFFWQMPAGRNCVDLCHLACCPVLETLEVDVRCRNEDTLEVDGLGMVSEALQRIELRSVHDAQLWHLEPGWQLTEERCRSRMLGMLVISRLPA